MYSGICESGRLVLSLSSRQGVCSRGSKCMHTRIDIGASERILILETANLEDS